ncbi:hypothetical protein [Streptomyces sp. NPDC004232]|uniref:hypothetical protein n=1 Tax=unclassified Streptomyces TaxID=2593676 RepID=UPI001D6FA683|nr:hypothetical protein [Streptomyces sp. tea 10]
MRRIQRAAVVAAVVTGLSALGAGASFADGYDAPPSPPQITAVAHSQARAVAVGGGTAVANSQANAVATWGGYQYGQPQYAAPSA